MHSIECHGHKFRSPCLQCHLQGHQTCRSQVIGRVSVDAVLAVEFVCCLLEEEKEEHESRDKFKRAL